VREKHIKKEINGFFCVNELAPSLLIFYFLSQAYKRRRSRRDEEHNGISLRFSCLALWLTLFSSLHKLAKTSMDFGVVTAKEEKTFTNDCVSFFPHNLSARESTSEVKFPADLASSSAARPWHFVRRVEWMWQSNENPFDMSQEEAQWTPYSDIENLVIEHAYQQKRAEVLLAEYHIKFAFLLQMSNSDEKRQRPVKRVTLLGGNERRLRKERFLAEPLLPSKAFSDTFCTCAFIDAAYGHFKYWDERNLEEYGADIRPCLVEKAAQGLIIEGKLLGKEWEGKQMAELLLSYKDSPLEEVAQMCAYIYSLDSFVWRKLNEIMRLTQEEHYESFWRSKVPTLGLFACLLRDLGGPPDDEDSLITVYRGCSLTEQAIVDWKRIREEHEKKGQTVTYSFFPYASFLAFTSTSRNREKAEFMGGNVLFVIEIYTLDDGTDISPYSQYDEEEFLLGPVFQFRVACCEYDDKTHKWIIRLTTGRCYRDNQNLCKDEEVSHETHKSANFTPTNRQRS
jgi:hypothetical protein